MADMISAVFNPVHRLDLAAGAERAIGRRLTWLRYCTVKSGRLEGQAGWTPIGIHNFPGWVPDEDLSEIEPITRQ